MLLIELKTTSPYFNLAAEEYLLKKDNLDKLILWQNDNSIIIGRNQNTLAEINVTEAEALNVNIVRRMSGGGAVYHDLGNLNYTFITQNDGNDFLNFRKFTQPVVDVLQNLGVNACLSGRNDLLIDNMKFSGNAQYVYKNMLLHHGTLMFNMNVDILTKVLNVKEIKIKSKGISSIKSRVTNINSYTGVTIPEFKRLLLENTPDSEYYTLINEDIAEITKLKNSKYDTWEWNFGFSPKYSFCNEQKLPCGIVEICMDIKDGIILNIKFSGDFFGKRDVSDVEQKLIGVRHKYEDIEAVLKKLELADYFAGASHEDILNMIF